ncbi:sugar porter family MFS transporter [Streptomyces sp. HNM0575]|uniref:MFS transporter n=1 Tax=Streptomyces sp. HNM0575 TaxID=2716338 RepID=UPI00145D9030|nr:MFS transporter [Streptomyces sp. HNM0575]NLU74044.1 sugar porter family MFS transporter [Streptomyces sp. HNM0575]
MAGDPTTDPLVHEPPAGDVASPRERKRLHTKLKLATQIGEGLDGYVIGGIGLALTALTADLHLSTLEEGLVGASPLIGIFVGGPFLGWLADRMGRRPLFLCDMLIFLIGSVLQFFVTDGAQLFIVRLIMGIAIGGEYAIGAPLLSEYAPSRGRGRLLASLEISWYVGYALATVVGALLAGVEGGWRWSLASSALIAAVCLTLRGGIPESARWLLSRGRRSEAEALIARYGIEVDVDGELAEGRQSMERRQGALRALFTRRHIRSTVFAGTFWACLVLPYFAISTFWGPVFEALGMGDNAAAALLVYSFTAVAGVTAGCLVVDRIGRRRLLIPPFWITAAGLALVAVWPESTFVIVAGFLFFIFLNAASSALTAVYPLEVFPTSVRTTGVGFATAMSRVGAAVGTFLLPMGLDRFGVEFVLLTGAGVLALGGVVSHFLAPETTDLDLATAARTARGDS